MFDILTSKKNMSDSDKLRRKIFLLTVGEVVLVLLLFGLMFFLFNIVVG